MAARAAAGAGSTAWPSWAVGALLLVVLCRVALDQPPSLNEGIWFHVARAWVEDGTPFYQGPIENKPPGIFYLFALAYRLTRLDVVPLRLAGVAAVLGCCLAVALIARRLAGREAALAAALAAGLVMASWSVDGPDITSTESFMVLGVAAAVARVLTAGARTGGRRSLAMLQAGAALGLALAFKQVAVADAPALLGFAWAATPAGARSLRRVAADAVWIAAGAALVTVASAAPLWLAGVSPREYLEGAWIIIGHGGSRPYCGSGSPHTPWRDATLYPLLLVAAAFLGLRRPLVARGVPWSAIVLWLALDVAAAVGSCSFFPHQFKQVVPPAAVAAGIVVALAVAALEARGWNRGRLRPVILAVLLVLLAPPDIHTANPTGPPRPPRGPHLEAGRWLAEHSAPGDLVYAWTGGGLVQAASGRSSPSRHFNKHFAMSDDGAEAVLRDLDRRPPRFVVIDRTNPAWLVAYAERCCHPVHQVGELRVFERRP